MHRRGHVGIALLAFTPIAYVLITDGKPALAVLSWVGIQTVEELPDMDLYISWLDHRGISHSLFAALIVGGVLGFGGWLLGTYVFDLLFAVLSLGAGVLGWVLGLFPEVVGEVFNALTPNLIPREIVSSIRQSAGGVDRWAVALFGFGVGVFGIFVHLLGDVITKQGIKPFLPVSSRQVSLSSLRSKSPTANRVLFGLGVVAIAVVVLVAAPVGLSPVDVAAGQSTTPNQNQTQSNASVTFANQTTNGSNVTIERATLPEGGFIAIHGSGYTTGGATADSSIIATSGYLSPGNYTNLTLPISQAPPGNYPGLNQSQLNGSETLAAAAYRDTDGNQQMDFVRSYGENDTAYTANGNVVSDTAGVTVPTPPRPQASVTVRNQTLQGDSVTIENATLPNGGFVVVHNDSYLPPESAPLESAVGITEFLEPGNYSNVEASLVNGSVTSDQRLVAVPYSDTNENQQYDYVATDGFQDTAYENRSGNQTIIVNDTATIIVEDTDTDSGPGEGGGAENPANTSTPFRVTNLSVSNHSAHVGDEVTVTAWITNPTNSRLEGELALATAGDTAETQQVALFPRESRTVTFTHSYDASGDYVIKVANHTERVRVVEEGTPLPTPGVTNADSNATANQSNTQAAEGGSGGSLSLTDIILIIILVGVLGGLFWVLVVLRRRT